MGNWPKLKDERDCRTNLRCLKPGCRRRGSLMPSGPSVGGAALASGPPRAASFGQRCRPWGWHAHFGCIPLCRAQQYLTRAASSPQRRASRLPAPPSPLAKLRAKARDRRYQDCQRLEGPRAPASRTAASAAWGALGGHRATRSRVPTPCGRLATAASASGKVGAGFPGGARSRRQGSVQRAVPRLCSCPAPTRTLYPLGLAHLLDGLLSDLPFASRPRRREGHGHGGGADSARDHWGLFSGCAPRPEVPILRSAGAGARGARCRGLARLPIANARSRPPRPRALFDCLPGPDPVRSPPTPGLRSASSRLPLRRPLCWVSVVPPALPRPAAPRRTSP